MATAHRTPTMIALRARHEAHGIAREILNPPLEIPPPPQPVMPIEPIPVGKPVWRFSQRVLLLIAIVLWIAAGSIVYATIFYHLNQP